MRRYWHLASGISILLTAGAAAQTTNVTNGDNGTTRTAPVYTGAATFGNSPISVLRRNEGVRTTSPAALPHISGTNAFSTHTI